MNTFPLTSKFLSATKDHITIQAGLSNLRHCIEAKVKGKAVPFTYFSLPRLLAPDFCGDAGISFVINCPSLADVDRIPETSETLDLARFILRLELAYKAQKATVHVAAEDLLKAADHKRLPEAKEVEAPAVQSFQSESDKEIKKLKKKLERRSQDIKELRAQLESQRLAPRIERLSKDLDKASAEDVRQLLKEVEKRYPEILQQAWPQWAEQLDKGDKSGLLELQKAVDQHEVHLQSLQWLLQRREESHLVLKNAMSIVKHHFNNRSILLKAFSALYTRPLRRCRTERICLRRCSSFGGSSWQPWTLCWTRPGCQQSGAPTSRRRPRSSGRWKKSCRRSRRSSRNWRRACTWLARGMMALSAA